MGKFDTKNCKNEDQIREGMHFKDHYLKDLSYPDQKAVHKLGQLASELFLDS
jgi:hypothetical protein